MNIESSIGFGGKEGFKDLYTRISEQALAILREKRIIEATEAEIKKAKEIIKRPNFREEKERQWNAHAGSPHLVDENPENQENLWANKLARDIMNEVRNSGRR